MTGAARSLLALTLACAAAGAAAVRAEAPERAVKPGEVFGGEAIRVEPPRGEGWIVRETATEIVFGRRGASPRETLVATVSFYELPEGARANAEALIAFVRAATEADLSPQRFAEPQASYAYDEARATPCVAYAARARDTRAPGGALAQAMHALYCVYERRPSFGYALVYSQRATAIDADLAEQAQAFFAGVRVPPVRAGEEPTPGAPRPQGMEASQAEGADELPGGEAKAKAKRD